MAEKWLALEDTPENRKILDSLNFLEGFCDNTGNKDALVVSIEKKASILAALNLDMKNTRVISHHDDMYKYEDGGEHYIGEGIFLEIAPKEKLDAASARQKYLKCCSQFSTQTERDLQKSIDTRKEKIDNLQRQLTQEIRNFNLEKAKLSNLKEAVAAKEREFIRDFDELIRLPHVLGVEVDDEKISVFTDHIVIERVSGKSKRKLEPRDIGEFRIDIYFNGDVAFRNLTRVLSGSKDHPHIEDHYPCFGNIEITVPELIADYQFTAVTMLIIRFLQSYNAEDPYCYAEDWPTVKQARKELVWQQM